jgi:hypothetical protein
LLLPRVSNKPQRQFVIYIGHFDSQVQTTRQKSKGKRGKLADLRAQAKGIAGAF